MSDLPSADRQDLARLEESLWRAETRFDRDHMEHVLAADFVEFGRSGRVHSRDDILAAPPGEISTALRDLVVRSLATDVALVTYVSEVPEEGDGVGNRSSIWTRTNGEWRLRFHQGTPASTT